MTKNEILDYLSKIDFDDNFKLKLESIVAKYVVFQANLDTGVCYNFRYYMSLEDAENDYFSRDFDLSCSRFIESLDGDGLGDETFYCNSSLIF